MFSLKLIFNTSKLNVADSLAQGSDVITELRLLLAHSNNFAGCLPAITNDSYQYQWELNPGSLSP